ncbi:MAG TPA: aldo/keto reductase [Steroidobacteraceae bacterium]|jgi:diketogulonate reductase-like aldo/keto reductase|nr:aldo/keto reductase [Steroidobacteraceae bacterium]
MTSRVPQRPFGTTGRPVAAIGQGSWKIEGASRAAAVAALRRGLDLGMTHIDTAELYGYGKAESLVAAAIAGRRDEVFLVSKVMPQNASRKGVKLACERSLQFLQSDRLDCYLLHWRGSVPLAETVAALVALQREGKILSWGVSNFDVDDLEELQALGAGLPACNQVLYHLRERAIEHGVIPWCMRQGVAVVAYTPFGPEPFPAPATAAGGVLADIAAAQGATPRQVALAFVIRHPAVFAIPKASTVEHVEENAAAGALHLSAEQLRLLEAAFPLRQKPTSLPMI